QEPGTSQDAERPRDKIPKDRTDTSADCWAAPPAPSSPPLASEAAGSPPRPLPLPRSPTLSVPPSSPTQHGGRETGRVVPESPPLAAPADSLPPPSSCPFGKPHFREALFPQAALQHPPPTAPHLTPTPCTKESPTPGCVDSPPLFLTTPRPGGSTDSSVVVQPGTSKPTSSTIAAKSSTLTSKPISDPAVVDMDTTPPSRAVTSTPPRSGMSCPPFARGRCSMTQRCPAKVAASTNPPTSMAPAPPHFFINSSASTPPLSPHTGLLLGGSQQLLFPVLLWPLACPTSVLEPPALQ
ncbi:nuclear pore-associated protein 1-like, partial [Canis lupus familiaris]|uniref:nuclear pore-associated protein 1-like n=1 Tax=Canis lupus familiaris TaxID=9615 RepID=UPI0018F633D5